ncbi:MAG: hypothetical protein ACE5DN_03700, partial [Flavobacteriales bacterium]
QRIHLLIQLYQLCPQQMTEPVPEMYVAQIDWSSISGLEPDYYYVQATSGIHSSVGIIEVHQVDPQERQLQHTTTNR